MDRRQFDALIAQWGEAVTPTGPPRRLQAGYSGMAGWIWPTASGRRVAKGHLLERVSPQRLDWVQRLCQYVHREGLAWLPYPLADPTGRTASIHGDRIWEVQTAIAGSADWCGRPGTTHIETVTRALAVFHRQVRNYGGPYPASEPLPPCLKIRAERLRWYGQRVSDMRTELLRRSGLEPDALRLSLEGLRKFESESSACLADLASVEDVRVPLGPCLRDVRPPDVFFQNEELAGFVDVMAADIDFPLVDLARFWSEVGVPAVEWPDWFDVYRSVHPVAVGAARLLQPLGRATRLVSIMNWVRWGVLHPRQGVGRQQVRARLQGLLE